MTHPVAGAPPPVLPPGLRRLAHAWGVEVSYHDARGRRVHASVDALVATLRALGAPLHRVEDARDALAERRRALWRQAIEPVTVAWDGRLAALELRLPASAAEGRARAEIELESGETRALAVDLSSASKLAGARVDGASWVLLRVALAETLPPGRHRLRLQLAGPSGGSGGAAAAPAAESWVISAPVRPAAVDGAPPSWGLFLPLYSLRSARSPGCGDLTDLDALGAWAAGHGGRVVSTLPLLPVFLDQALFQPSPYLPVTRMAWNELYLDLSREPEWERVGAVRAGADGGPVGAGGAWAGAGGTGGIAAAGPAPSGRPALLDYRRLAARRHPVLRAMAEAAFGSSRRDAIERFLDGHPRLRDYARFRAACVRHGGPWCRWPEAARGGRLTDDDLDGPTYRAHAYAQFAAAGQVAATSAAFAARGQRLLLDLPLGVHRDGHDVWSRPALFAAGASCGAPPDFFFAKGQDWGLPPIVPDAARRDGHLELAQTLRHHLSAGKMLRIDHAPGLHRLFWVPHGFPATEGVYVRGRPEEAYAVLCLEASRSGGLLVGEDLGTVPRGLRSALARHGMWRTHVLQFTPHARVPRAALACLNTHDTPPFAGFVRGRDIADARELGQIDDAKASAALEARAGLVADLRGWLEEREGLAPGADRHAFMTACYGRLAASRASLVLLNLEDLWEEERPQNVPGTSDERPNWRHPAALALEEFAADAGVAATLAAVDRRRREAGRRPRRPEAPEGPSRLGDLDLDLFAQGRHAHADDLLGSRRRARDGVQGVQFVAWAPDAEALAVVGDFNGWDRARHPMARVGDTGLWEAFVPGARRRALYKYVVAARGGAVHEAPDPFMVRAERPPGDASMIWSLDFDWTDHAWLRTRAEGAGPRPAEIVAQALEVPAAGWSGLRWTRREAPDATHLVLPRDARLGRGAGIAPAPGHGPPQELMAAIDGLHARGLGVLVAWSPPSAGDCVPGGGRGGWTGGGGDAAGAERPELAGLQVSAALAWVRVYHADGLVVAPDDPAVSPTLRADLVRELAARHPGALLLDGPG